MFRKIASILLTGALAFSLLTAPIAHGAAEVYFSTDFSQVNGGFPTLGLITHSRMKHILRLTQVFLLMRAAALWGN